MTVVTTTNGPVRGLEQDGLLHFRGVRYAAPPVGALRFRPPQEPQPWAEPADATAFGTISVQDADPLSMDIAGTEAHFYPEGARTDEDCLFLNVVTPGTAGSRPVLVWIHGGAFLWGSGSGGWFDGTRFATDHDVVVVTINYRLGVLGFAWLEEHEPGAGNLGIQDQIAALAWVHANIAAFGGDPSRVGIVGESAGGGSVLSLMASPAASGLLSRAIVESGNVDHIATPERGAATTAELLSLLQIDPDRGEVVPALRRTSLLRLQAAQRALRRGPGPVAGGVIAADPLSAIAATAARGVPLLIGSNAEEDKLGWTGRPYPERFDLDAHVRALIGDERSGEVLRLYPEHTSDPVGTWDVIGTDHHWTAPTRRTATAYAAAGGTAFLYRFAWRSDALDGRLGAGHFLEIPFVFDVLGATGVVDLLGPRSASEGAHALAAAMNAYWASFLADGVPIAPGRPAWPEVDPAGPAALVLDEAIVVDAEPSARLDLWDGVAIEGR